MSLPRAHSPNDQQSPEPGAGTPSDAQAAEGRLGLVMPSADDTGSLRALKIAVIAMGVILVLGFFTVIGRIVYLMTRGGATPATIAATGTLAIPADGEVRSMALSADRLALHIVRPNGDRTIVILDIATGKAVSRIMIGPEVPTGAGPAPR